MVMRWSCGKCNDYCRLCTSSSSTGFFTLPRYSRKLINFMLKETHFDAPLTLDALLARAHALAGRNLATLAAQHQIEMPADLTRQKGWLGDFLELVLGADQHNLPEPDFTNLGVELKTLPINEHGKPLESTFVCTIPLLQIKYETFTSSTVWKKLQCVLWIPIISKMNQQTLPLAQRIIATPLLWQPNAQQRLQLQTDWQTHVDQIVLGKLTEINARAGEVLQIRPKGLDGRTLCHTINEQGELAQTLPRGFYLRAAFTHSILADYFRL